MLKQVIKQHKHYFKYWYKWNFFLLGIGTKYIAALDEEGLDNKLENYLIVQQHKGLLLYKLIKSIYYRYKFIKYTLHNLKNMPEEFTKGVDVDNLDSYQNYPKTIQLQGTFHFEGQIPDFMKNVKFSKKTGLKITDISDNMMFPVGENIYLTKDNYYPRRLFELFNTDDHVVRDMMKDLISIDIVNFENQILQTDVKRSVEKIQ